MKRLLLAALVALGALALLPSESFAHGGQFRGPGGAVPPGMREPTDPTPPPPPPPSGGTTPPSTPPTTPPGSPPTTPTTPTPPVTPTPPTVGGERGKQTGIGFQDWTFWYNHNKDEIENLKRRLYLKISSQNPLFQIGGNNVTNRGDETRLTEKKVEDVIIPSLIWAMDPKNSGYTDTESAAYIALAKLAKSPAHIELIKKGLDKALKRDAIVQESTALALGLLRRAAPDDQFSARELDRVRLLLFDVFQDDAYGARTRGFAALALGLLGDQPSGSPEYLTALGTTTPTTGGEGSRDEARKAAERATSARLFELLKSDYSNPDLPVGLLVALGLQPSETVTEDMRKELTNAALKGQLFGKDVQAIVRGNAALTLARVGGREELGTMRNVLTSRKSIDDNTQRSAAIGVGVLGRALPSADRVKAAEVLVQAIEKAKDDSIRNFSIISLAYLLIAEVQEGKTDILNGKGADEALFGEATGGKYYQRPFGAMALGLVVSQVTDEMDNPTWQEFKSNALKILRDGLDDQKMDKQARAAFATALGIARDNVKRERLIEIVADRKEDKDFRGYAALSLGLIGDALPQVTKAIAEALKERSSEDLRRQTATALGLLGNPKIGGTGQDAIQLLLEELKVANSQAHKGQVVVALARIGNDKAVDPLVEMLKDSKEQDLTRALSCAGLGIIGDLEWLPSLSRISKDINYRLSCDILNEVLSIL